MKRAMERVDIKREDLERLVEHARPALSEAEYLELTRFSGRLGTWVVET